MWRLHRAECDNRHNHFLERNSTVLERILVVVDELVIVCRIDKVIIFFGNNVIDVQPVLRQFPVVWIFDENGMFELALQVASVFVAQVCRGFTVADNFGATHATDAAMVSGNEDGYALFSKRFEHAQKCRVLKPSLRQATKSRFIGQKLTNDL